MFTMTIFKAWGGNKNKSYISSNLVSSGCLAHTRFSVHIYKFALNYAISVLSVAFYFFGQMLIWVKIDIRTEHIDILLFSPAAMIKFGLISNLK